MSFVISPNMNLPIPGVGTEQGPNYAFDVDTALTLIDQHDHSPGKGIQITPAGININAALNFNDNPLTNLAYESFIAQTVPSTAIQSISVAPAGAINELFYTDSNGTTTQITKNGTVNAIIASIPGESYAAGTFYWTQAQSSLPTTPANFSIGSITLQPNVASTVNGVTLIPPSSVATTFFFPSFNSAIIGSTPSAASFVQMDMSGNISQSDIPIVGGLTSSNISPTAGILPTQLATAWNILEFTSGSSTWTVPAGVTNIIITGCGGGGGGGGGAASTGNSADNAGGGGSGCPITVLAYDVTPGQVISYSIGSGGTSGIGGAGSSGGGSTGAAGGIGGNTTFGTLTFYGGNPGQGGASGGSGGSSAGGLTPFIGGTNGGSGGTGGANPGAVGQNLPTTIGGTGGSASGTGGQGGGGGGAGSYSNSSNGGSGETSSATSPGYVFTLAATTSIHCGTVFTNNGHIFTAAQTTTSSATLICHGTGAPSASGTLTYIYGDTPGNLTFNSVVTNGSIITGGPGIPPSGISYGVGGGGGGSCFETVTSALGGPGMKGGNGYVSVQWWGPAV